MAGEQGEEIGKQSRHGRRPPRITKENGEWLLLVNEPAHLRTPVDLAGDMPLSILDITNECPRKPYRYSVYRSFKQTAQDSEWVYCHHRIDTEALHAKTHESLRYLYRVVSDQSGGINTAECFQSQAVKEESPANMASMEEIEIRQNLLSHMRNKKFPSHWISFTTSPLWAFDLALRMKRRGEKEICIVILDTLQLSHPIRVFHTPALLKAYNVEKSLWPMMYRGAAEKLVWDEVIAPGTLIPLANFLKSYLLEGDDLKQGYSALQPFHFRSLDFAGQPIDAVLNLLQQNPVKGLYIPAHIRTRNFKSEVDKQHEIEVRKHQAEKTWRQKHTAGRLSYGKQLNNPWDKNTRVPISAYTVGSYMTLVEDNFPPEFQFPILIALLSTRLYHFEYSGVVEAFELLAGKSLQSWCPKDEALV